MPEEERKSKRRFQGKVLLINFTHCETGRFRSWPVSFSDPQGKTKAGKTDNNDGK
jgi:hypothetical protein